MSRPIQFKIAAIVAVATMVMITIAASEINHQAYALTQSNSGFTANNNLIGANVGANVAVCGNNILATMSSASC